MNKLFALLALAPMVAFAQTPIPSGEVLGNASGVAQIPYALAPGALSVPLFTGSFSVGDCVKVGASSPVTFEDAGAPCGGGSGTPGGSTTQFQYNLAGSFAGSANFTYDGTHITVANSDFQILGSSTGYTTVTSANAGATNYTLTIPANSGTLAELNLAQTFTATQTLDSPILVTPQLGTPASGVGTNITGVNAASVGGFTLPCTVPTLVNGDYLTNNGSTCSWAAGGGSGITTLTGDVVAGPGSGSQAATVVKINGGSVPASAALLGTNSSSQPVAVTASSSTVAALSTSTPFTVAGSGSCTPSVTHAGPFAGIVTLSGTCNTGETITVTINGAPGFPAPNGYHCTVNDQTLQAAGTWFGTWGENSSTAAYAVIGIPAAAGNTDVLSIGCSDWY